MSGASPAGRLSLSWLGKDKALLSTATGGYEWVNRDDPRVTEVRPFRVVSEVGDRVEESAAEENLLIQGDSYDAMHALVRVPEFSERYRGKVKLVYPQ